VAKSKRLLQEVYKPLVIAPPETDDPAIRLWAEQLIQGLNLVLIRTLKENQDRLLAALAYGTGGIATSSILIGDWRIEVDGNNLSVYDPDGNYQGGWSYT